MDKFGARDGAARVRAIEEALELDSAQVVPVSARTGLGRDELAGAIVSILEQPAWRPR